MDIKLLLKSILQAAATVLGVCGLILFIAWTGYALGAIWYAIFSVIAITALVSWMIYDNKKNL